MSEGANDVRTFARNAKGVRELLSMKFDTLPFEGKWHDAFGTPERCGVWIVWGKSGSGKTSFVMKLCKELCKYGRVVYDSLEEGISLTMQDTVRRSNMLEANRRFLLVCEPMDELSLRLKRQKSPDFVVIDSFQYTQMTYAQYIKFKERHKNKLLIFISHAQWSEPGRAQCQESAVRRFAENLCGRQAGNLSRPFHWPERIL